ncbi:unnamed protein product [Rotaria sp. Silwood1]|nr:unnamed protein product [Rotaria sp. Silwood1]
MSPGGGDYWPNQPFLHLNGDLTRCTEAQLREAGYTPPPNPIYPRHPVPIERTVEEPALDQTAHIYIRCLQPPPLPPGVSFRSSAHFSSIHILSNIINIVVTRH